MTQSGERGRIERPLEARAPCAQQFDDFVLDDTDEAACGSCSGGEFCDASDLVDFSSARGCKVFAAPSSHDELADDKSYDEQHDGGLELVLFADGERVVGW